ncbi:MAG: Hsp20/alpha crystallin family protein, partial [Burkholderiaceae bacterium]
MDNMLEEFLAPWENQESGISSPRMNVVENDQAFVVEADMPGVAKEDIKLSVDNRRVSIEGEVKRESSQKDGQNVLHSERLISRFSRSFTLPAEVDENRADARLENGVLILTLPKK